MSNQVALHNVYIFLKYKNTTVIIFKKKTKFFSLIHLIYWNTVKRAYNSRISSCWVQCRLPKSTDMALPSVEFHIQLTQGDKTRSTVRMSPSIQPLAAASWHKAPHWLCFDTWTLRNWQRYRHPCPMKKWKWWELNELIRHNFDQIFFMKDPMFLIWFKNTLMTSTRLILSTYAKITYNANML